MTAEQAWAQEFNNLPIEKRREIIAYGIHDEIRMLEAQKIHERSRYQKEIEDIDSRIDALRRHRDRVWNEIIRGQP